MKTVLITGASRGIGRAIAKEFAKNNYAVAINYNKSENDANSLLNEIKASDGCAMLCKADVSNKDEVNQMVDMVIKNFGHIDVLVNNAGISSKGLFIDESFVDMMNIVNTNLISAINLSKKVIPSMLENEKGKIINISSIWGNVGGSMEVSYSTSKAGIIGLTKSLAKEYGYNNINVNCICPGAIDTQMNDNLTFEEKQELIRQIPAGRLGKPEEIAKIVLFLSNDTGDYINGQVITIDGGFTL